MHFSAIALTIVTAIIGSTSASAVAPRALVSVNQASSSLLSRQAACVSYCTPVQDGINTCGTDSCMCSPSLAYDIQNCFNCRLQIDPTLLSQLQSTWDQYSSECATAGFPISDSIDGGSSVTPTVIATPTTTTPDFVYTPSPIVTSAAAAVSSAAPAVSSVAPAVSTASAASSNFGASGGGLIGHANAAPILNAGGALGLLVVGVVAALL